MTPRATKAKTTKGLRRVAVIEGVRTPFCKSATAFADMTAVDLGKIAVRELLARNLDETSVGGDPHDRLSDREGDDLRVGQDASGVLRRLRQEIVSSTEHSNQQQVEVGEHRGPLGSTARIGAADFDLTAPGPYLAATASAVELLI